MPNDMSPDDERKGRIVAASKWGGEASPHTPTTNQTESASKNSNNFLKLCQERYRLINKPNLTPQEEKRLAEISGEIDNLFNEAKSLGLFASIKYEIESAQSKIGNTDLGGIEYQQAIQQIRSFDTNTIEENMKKNLAHEWKNQYEGMVEEYKNVAVMAMDHAWLVARADALRASGRDEEAARLEKRAEELEKQIDIRKFGDIPQEPYLIAEEEVARLLNKNKTAPQWEDADMAAAIARGQGGVTPEIMDQIEEGATHPIDITLNVPYLLVKGLHGEEKKRREEEWKARAAILSLAANKQRVTSYEKLMENPEAYTISNETLETAMSIEGTFEAAAIHVAMISEKVSFESIGLQIPNPDYDPTDKSEDKKSYPYLRDVFDIKTNKQFESYRNRIRKLLLDKGILNSEDRAKTAERVSWNLVFANNVVEEFDSKYNPGHTSLIPNTAPSHFKNVATWMVMHPQERLAAKATGEVPEAMGKLGSWALFVASKKGNKFTKEVLPRALIKNGLRQIKFNPTDAIKNKYREIIDQKTKQVSIFDVLRSVGMDIIGNISTSVSAKSIPWQQIGNNPFSGYYLESISPAVKYFSVVMNGQESKITGQELGNIARKLKLDKKSRINLLKIWKGIKTKSNKLKVAGKNDLEWWLYLKEFQQYNPSYLQIKDD